MQQILNRPPLVTDLTKQGSQLRPTQPAHRQAFHLRITLETSNHCPPRMPPMQLITAVGEHQRHRCVAQVPAQKRHQIPRRRIRPMQILEDNQQLLPRRQPADQPKQLLEEPTLLNAAALANTQQHAHAGRRGTEQLGEFLLTESPTQPAQRLDQR